jgi:hypothetical protein
VRTSLFLKIKMLIPLPGVRIFFGGEPDPFVNYFVKTKPGRYHKILIPAQN